jgi:hypothetical protein
MTDDPDEFAKGVFKAGQQPGSWLRSAGRLRDAAEAVINHELPAGTAYLHALRIADEQAEAESVRNDTGADGVNATNERSALRCVGKQPQSHRNGRLFLDRAFEGTFRHISGRVLFLPHETNVTG